MEPKFCGVTVTDSTGKSVDRGGLQVASDDPKQLTIGLAPITAATYSVKLRVLSVDGHVVASHFSFTVR
jgi:methionine-rich copper-binding protein CopC